MVWTVIYTDASIDNNNVRIYQHITIAGRIATGVPVIGDNFKIGSGAKILGTIEFGANAVVIKNVTENAKAVGVPTRIKLE